MVGKFSLLSFLSSRTVFLIIQAIADNKIEGRRESNASGAELTTDAFLIMSEYKSPKTKRKKYQKLRVMNIPTTILHIK